MPTQQTDLDRLADVLAAYRAGEAAVAAFVLSRWDRCDDDVLQEIALAAILSVRRSRALGLSDEVACRHLLRKVRWTRLECYRQQRRRRMIPVVSVDDDSEAGLAARDQLHSLSTEPCIDGETCAAVREAMTRLRPLEFRSVARFWGIGCDAANTHEQAVVEGVSHQAVHQRLTTAVSKLRRHPLLQEVR